uniref:DnaJ homolog subfamily C member 1 n=1 Tax=Cacopsylla melanoneura TaxID=428564 RepID=A0A8D8S0Y8_9HEMI
MKSMFYSIPCIIIVVLCHSNQVGAWDSDQLHVFDVVEEVKQNFYELLEIPKDADLGKIKKAFRKLSLVLHPDKSDAPDAEIKFRQLVSVYDVLRDSNKRSHYNQVLENGLPDWRSAVYYFRRVRKMGLAEMSIILFVIISIGQYLVSWASYAEKQFTLNEMRNKKQGRKPKKNKGKDLSSGGDRSSGGNASAAPESFEEYLEQSPAPSIKNTLPVQIPCLIWFLVIKLPPLVYVQVGEYLRQRRERSLAESQSSDESEPEPELLRGPRKRRGKGFVLPEVSTSGETTPVKSSPQPARPTVQSTLPPIPVSGGLWTDDDLVELIRLVKKYPQGTPNRWDKIAEQIQRSVGEITFMANKIKEQGYKIPSQNEDKAEVNLEDDVKKVKKRAEDSTESKLAATMKPWNAMEQKSLENALKKYPKGCVGDRWEKISNSVPGRTKEECVLRYKQLFKALKEKKGNEEKENQDKKCEEITVES